MSNRNERGRGRLLIWGAVALFVVLGGLALWYWLGGRSMIAAKVRYLSAHRLEVLAVEVTGKSVQVFALVPHPQSDPYDMKPGQTALVGTDRFWVPVEVENRSEDTMYLRMHSTKGGPQLLLPAVEYRLGAGRKQSVLLPFSREGLGENKRVVVNVTLSVEGERLQSQIILFDISPVEDVFSGREPGSLILTE